MVIKHLLNGMILPSSDEQISSQDAPFSFRVNNEQMVIAGLKAEDWSVKQITVT